MAATDPRRPELRLSAASSDSAGNRVRVGEALFLKENWTRIAGRPFRRRRLADPAGSSDPTLSSAKSPLPCCVADATPCSSVTYGVTRGWICRRARVRAGGAFGTSCWPASDHVEPSSRWSDCCFRRRVELHLCVTAISFSRVSRAGCAVGMRSSNAARARPSSASCQRHRRAPRGGPARRRARVPP